MWKSTSITVENKDYKVEVFVGVVDDTKNKTQTGISGGSFSTEKYGSSNISTTHTNFQEVWLVGSNNSEASISLKNKSIQARTGNTMILVRIEGIDYWVFNQTTNTKYQLSENPSKLFLKRNDSLYWILTTLLFLIPIFLFDKVAEGSPLWIIAVLIPFFRHRYTKNRNRKFDATFNSTLSNSIQNLLS